MMINRKFAISAGLLGAMAISIAASMPKPQDKAPEWKNLKVLPKKISGRQLHDVMEGWSASLGVHCNFCHARDEANNKMDFASDAKPEKNMAREMFEMAAKINKKYFKAEKDSLGMVMLSSVNCNTCHHGNAHPEAKLPEHQRGPGGPPPGGQGNPPPPPPAPPSGQ